MSVAILMSAAAVGAENKIVVAAVATSSSVVDVVAGLAVAVVV